MTKMLAYLFHKSQKRKENLLTQNFKYLFDPIRSSTKSKLVDERYLRASYKIVSHTNTMPELFDQPN